MPKLANLQATPVQLDEAAINRITGAVGETPRQPDRDQLKADLVVTCRWFIDLNASPPKGAYRDFIGTTNLYQFLGDSLARLFDKHFGKNPRAKRAGSRSRDPHSKDAPTGPYVRFALAVMSELGREISPETVATAIKRVRKRDPDDPEPKEGEERDGCVFKDGCWQDLGR